jgi:uncharacterized protein
MGCSSADGVLVPLPRERHLGARSDFLRSDFLRSDFLRTVPFFRPAQRMTSRSIPAPKLNPFEIGLIARGNHFADREDEVERIARTFRSPGSRLVVYGDRRLGKSSAIDRAAEVARKAKQKVVVATLATATDPADAAQQVVRGVREQIGRGWRATLDGIARRLQAGMELTPGIDGAPPGVRLVFGLRETERERRDLLWEALDAVNAQMEAEGTTLAIALDEFQRIHEWGGEDAEWALKASLETHRNLAYVLAGSRRHLIEGMITRKGRALWKQVDSMAFEPIDPQILAEWIHQHAARTGVSFSLAACDRTVELAGPRTRDIVQLARAAWDAASRIGSGDEALVERAMESLVQEQGALFSAQWRSLSASYQRVLRAIAAEAGAVQGTDAIQRYRLGPKSTVSSALTRLVDSEVLTRDDGGRYGFDDPFFRRWVERFALADLGLPTPPLRRGGRETKA